MAQEDEGGNGVGVGVGVGGGGVGRESCSLHSYASIFQFGSDFLTIALIHLSLSLSLVLCVAYWHVD